MKPTVLALTPPVLDTADALVVLDDLRAAVVSGQVKAFVCVGIEPDHATKMWTATTHTTSRLEMLGAIANLQHCYQDMP